MSDSISTAVKADAALGATNAHRPTIMGTRHMASAAHYGAAHAAFAILEAGGNAVDAGVAGGIALGVLQCDIVNVAGVAPIILREAKSGEVHEIAGLGTWPKRTKPEVFRREHGGHIPPGLLRTVVPAAPDAWITALERFGTMSFAEVAEASIRFAEGFAMYPLLADMIALHEAEYRRWPSNAEVYLPNGRPPKVSELFVQSDLAKTLRYMADEEKARGRHKGARDAFYKGDIARTITSFHEANGGWLAMDDMAEYRSEVGRPVASEWNGIDVYTCGPWCQGPVLLQALALLDAAELRAAGHNSLDYIHVIVEALKLAFADRERFYGDPRFIDVPLRKLLSPGYAAERKKLLRRDRAWVDAPPTTEVPPVPRDTSYVCVVDRWGNVFSATPSDVSFESPVIPGTGLCPSSRGSQNWADTKHPSGVAPGKRPRLTPNPALAVKRGEWVMPFGTPGGDVQSQAMLQVLLNVFVHGQDVQSAIENPRFASYSYPSSFAPYDYYPGRLSIEGRFPEEVTAELARRGHQVERWPDWIWLAGAVCGILVDKQRGTLEAGADPRRAAYALGW